MMEIAAPFFAYIAGLLKRFDSLAVVVITVNLLLIFFAKQILLTLYSHNDKEREFALRLNIFRALNLLIIVSFGYYHMYMPAENKGLGLKLVSIFLVLYLGYLAMHILHRLILRRYGWLREAMGEEQLTETYNSRLIGIFASTFVVIIVLISIIRILGFSSLLEAGGVIGFIGVFLALTQGSWAPDVLSGLIILNSNMVEVGDVIELGDERRTLGVVHKTKVFHTEILDLVNNHRLMIKNARLRDYPIHNLSKFASARGLREPLHFNIDYHEGPDAVKKMFEKAYAAVAENADIPIETQHPLEVRVSETGNYAVQWTVYYYTKDVRSRIKTRQQFLEVILETSRASGISLATPLLHIMEPPREKTTLPGEKDLPARQARRDPPPAMPEIPAA